MFKPVIDEETCVPLCPYCEKPLEGPIVNGLHEACNEKLQAELDAWERVQFVQE